MSAFDKKYSYYKQVAQDFLEYVDKDENWKNLAKRYYFASDVEKYCEKKDKTPIEFTDVEIRDLIWSIRDIKKINHWENVCRYYRPLYFYFLECGLRKDNPFEGSLVLSTKALNRYAADNYEGDAFITPQAFEDLCFSIPAENKVYYESILRSFWDGVAKDMLELSYLKKRNPVIKRRASDKLLSLYKELAGVDTFVTLGLKRRTEQLYHYKEYLLPIRTRKSTVELSESEYIRASAQNHIKTLIKFSKTIGRSLNPKDLYQSGLVYRVVDKVGGQERFNELMAYNHRCKPDGVAAYKELEEALKAVSEETDVVRFIRATRLFAGAI